MIGVAAPLAALLGLVVYGLVIALLLGFLRVAVRVRVPKLERRAADRAWFERRARRERLERTMVRRPYRGSLR